MRFRATARGPAPTDVAIEARISLWCARMSLLIQRRDVPRDVPLGAATTAAGPAEPSTPN